MVAEAAVALLAVVAAAMADVVMMAAVMVGDMTAAVVAGSKSGPKHPKPTKAATTETLKGGIGFLKECHSGRE